MILKRICPKCKSQDVIGITKDGIYSLNCLRCKHVERVYDHDQALMAWHVEEVEA